VARFEFYCPITGEKQTFRTQAGEEAPTPFYSAGATREQIDAFEKAHPKRAVTFKRHPHQVAEWISGKGMGAQP